MLRAKRAHAIVWLSAASIGVITRTVALGRWPGLNGDESWYGVNVQEWFAGGTPFLNTGVGNPLSPIHSGLLLAFSSIFEPSAALLRAPEALLGIAAVLLAYPLLRAPLGERTALLTTVLLAVSPAAIAYSRIGWDPGGTPLMMLLATSAALRDRPILALVVMAFAYLVHPTNVFGFPIVLAAWMPHAASRFRAATAAGQRRVKQTGIALLILALPIGAWLLIRIANNPATPLPSISMALERVVSPALWLDRLWGAFSLLSGVTSVVYIAAPMSTAVATAATAIIALLIVGSLIFASPQWRTRRHAAWFLAGIAVAFAGFHVVAIANAFDPGFERYALFLLTPMLIASAIAIDAGIARASTHGTAAATTIAVVMLTIISGGYFYPLATIGGASELTYRTGLVEPKLAAFRFIEQDSKDATAVTIVANDWWLYWTLRYFAGTGSRFHVVPDPAVAIPGGTNPARAISPAVLVTDKTYRVLFATPGAAAQQSNALFTATDPRGSPIVDVVLLPQQYRP